MKKLVVLFVIIVACEAKTVNPPPQVLLPEDVMENILYDLNLLKSIKNNSYGVDISNEILNNNYILRKYNIADSTLKQNQLYYAQSPKKMYEIYNRINLRLEKAEDSVKGLIKQQREEKEALLKREEERLLEKRKHDSLALLYKKDSLALIQINDSLTQLKLKDSVNNHQGDKPPRLDVSIEN